MKFLNKLSGASNYLCLAFFLLTAELSNAQQIVNGTVSDSQTGEALENVTVLLKKADIHFHTLQNGSFVLKTTVLPDSLLISAMGYEQAAYSVDSARLSFKIRLDRRTVELAQVNVTSRRLLVEVMGVDLKMNPVNTSQDFLRKVPGLFTAQHAGGGKAEHLILSELWEFSTCSTKTAAKTGGICTSQANTAIPMVLLTSIRISTA